MLVSRCHVKKISLDLKGELNNMTNWGEPNAELNTNETKRPFLQKAHNDMMIGYNFCRCQ